MSTVRPCLWFDGNAEEAANFYVSVFADGEIESVQRSPLDWPSGKAGEVIVVEFRVAGQRFIALNGGPEFRFDEAVSFQVATDDQAETDRLWSALTADGGEESVCGWLKDRFGLSWQVTPRRLTDLMADPDRDRARKAMQAMMQMRKIDIAALERAIAA